MRLIEIYRNFNPRLQAFYVLVIAVFLVLSGGLAFRQLIYGPLYQEKESLQNLRRVIVPGPRGNIFDRGGNLLVGNRPRFSAVVYLNELRVEFRQAYQDMLDAEAEGTEEARSRFERQVDARSRVVQSYLNRINRILGKDEKIEPTSVDRHFRQQLLLPFPLVEDLDPGEYAILVEQLPVSSPIQIFTDSARFYPYDAAACHVLGYVGGSREVSTEGLPGEELMTFNVRGMVGKTGIEKQFNEHLQGQSGGEIWVVDPSGFKHRVLFRKAPVKGKDLALTLDVDLQRIAERGLDGQHGAVVALDLVRGEVLAMASLPNYNLNDLSPIISLATARDINERGAWLNRALSGLYPPGSTFKIVTSVAGLRAGVLDPREEFMTSASYRVGSRLFHEHNRAGFGMIDLPNALRVSSNTYFYHFSQKITVEPIQEEAKAFGLDQPTGIELPFETDKALVPTREWKLRTTDLPWFPGDTANLSIGQGFLRVTPLRMACMVAAFARNERRFHPTLIYDPLRPPLPAGEPLGLEPSDYQAVVRGMEMAVESGTARNTRIDGVRIAGKTGTAQVQSPEGMIKMAWFTGFAPVENPRIAVVVLVEGKEVSDALGGGTSAAPVARPVFEAFLLKSGLL